MLFWSLLVLVVVLVFVFLFLSAQNSDLRGAVAEAENLQEDFQVAYAVLQGTEPADQEHTKALLEIGSQADENKKYDVVSTKYLGNRVPIPTQVVTTPPPDPICFTEELDHTHVPIWDRPPCCGDVTR